VKNSLSEKLHSLVLERQATGELLTVAQASEALQASQRRIVLMAEDLDLCVNVALSVGGRGYAKLPRSRWMLEDINITPD
jgi:hypothetical protein